MGNEEVKDIAEALEDSLSGADDENYVLVLYVAGQTPRSATAIANIRKLCERELRGRYVLEIVDIYQEPERAKDEQLFAVPTLIKKLPAPLRRIIGDLSDTERVVAGMNLRRKKHR